MNFQKNIFGNDTVTSINSCGDVCGAACEAEGNGENERSGNYTASQGGEEAHGKNI